MIEERGGESATPEKKSRKALPPVDAAAVSAAEADTEAAKPLTDEPAAPVAAAMPAARDLDHEFKTMNASLAKANSSARIALGVAVAALLLVFTSAWWSPRVFDNDLATRKSTVLAATQLRVLANHDEPFAAELALLARALPEDKATKEAVAVITPLARTGVPTLATLTESFQGTADHVLVGQVVAKDDQSWVKWGLHKVASAIRIDALAGTVAAPPADLRIVHDAEAALKDGNLAEAVDQLSKLEGNSADEVGDWLEKAKSRTILDRAVADIAQIAESRSANRAWLR